MNINDMMSKMGFGESTLIRTKSKSKNIGSYSEASYVDNYAYIMANPYREALQLKNIEDKLGKIKSYCEARGIAFSEDLSDVKDTVKEGWDKIKRTLSELYERAIRFFTETVRYFFSNEKKIGKKIAKYNATIKKSGNGSKKAIKVYEGVLPESKGKADTSSPQYKAELEEFKKSMADQLNGNFELKGIDKKKKLNKIKEQIKENNKTYFKRSPDMKNRILNLLDNLWDKIMLSDRVKEAVLAATLEERADNSNITGDDADDVKDTMDEIITLLKEKFEENQASIDELMKGEKTDMAGTEVVTRAGAQLELVVAALDGMRKMEGSGMRGLNKSIRKLQDKLKDLKKEFKENKDKSEDARDDYKKDRAILVQQIRYINVYKSLKDKAIGGVFFKLGDYLDTTLNTAKNAKD